MYSIYGFLLTHSYTRTVYITLLQFENYLLIKFIRRMRGLLVNSITYV